MVAGHRLMHRQHLHLVLGAHLWPVEVHIIKARPAAVGRRRLVVGGGGVGRAGRRDCAQPVGRAGQLAEKLHETWIDALGDREVGVEQFLRRLIEELRVGAQEHEEFLQRAPEAHLILDLDHLGADACHLGESDGVDLLGGEPGQGGVVGDAFAVVVGTLRRTGDADARTRGRQVALDERGLQAPIGGQHRRCDRCTPCGLEPRAVGGADPVREALEGRVERALLRCVDDLQRELRRQALHDRARLRASFADGFVEQRDVLVYQRSHPLQTLDPILIIFDRLKGQYLGCLGEGLDAAHMVDLVKPGLEGVGRETLLVFAREQVVVELLGGCQPRARDGA